MFSVIGVGSRVDRAQLESITFSNRNTNIYINNFSELRNAITIDHTGVCALAPTPAPTTPEPTPAPISE